VDPCNPPPFCERFYARAGWPPPLPDQDPILAPKGEWSMHDTYRTTADELMGKTLEEGHPLYGLYKRFRFYQFPNSPPVNTRVLMLQATDKNWEEFQTLPIKLEYVSKCCRASYLVSETSDDPHCCMILTSPIVIRGAADIVWKEIMQIPVASVFLTILIGVAPLNHFSKDDNQRKRSHEEGRGNGERKGEQHDHKRHKHSGQGERRRHEERDGSSHNKRQATFERNSESDSDSFSDSIDSNHDVRFINDSAGIKVGHSKS
jgi:hypothetical protein